MLNANAGLLCRVSFLSKYNISWETNGLSHVHYCLSFQHSITDAILSIATDDVDLQKSAAKLVPAMLVSVTFFDFNTVHYFTPCSANDA